MKSDRYVIAGALLLAAVYFYATEQIPTLQIGDPMGAKAIPRLLGVVLLVSAGLLWLEMRLAAREPTPGATPGAPDDAAPATQSHWPVVAGVVAWTALYFAAFETLGYALATSVYLIALTAYFNPGRWLANVSTSVLFSVVSYLAFTRLFGAQLAPGLLPF
ncbi:MAG: tripartite tricarboxylate transporter TctB family protein [Burkholderiaceae bacterium]